MLNFDDLRLPAQRKKAARSLRGRRLALEALEDRSMLSLFPITIDAQAFGGQYGIGGGPPELYSGQNIFNLEGGTSYGLNLHGIGGFSFAVDASGTVSTASAAAQASGSTLTLNNKTVHVDPRTFGASYTVGWTNAPYVTGPADFVVVGGLEQDYGLAIHGIGWFPFAVDAAGTVSTTSGAAQASGSTLTLNNKTVHVDPDAFGGSYTVGWTNAPYVTGPADFVVVGGLAQDYGLAIHGIGWFPFNVDAGGTVSTTSGAAQGSGSTLILNNQTVHVDPDGYSGAYTVDWIGAPFVTGAEDFVVVGGLAQNYSLHVASIGHYSFSVDAAGVPAPSVVPVVVDGATYSFTLTPGSLVQPSQVAGWVWEDFNNDGELNFGEKAVAGVTIELRGTDDLGHSVSLTTATDEDGLYGFADLRPGTYTITEVQPAGYEDGRDTPGLINGVPGPGPTGNDQFLLALTSGSTAENFNFGERPLAGGGASAGQTATIGFWQNKHGQALIRSLNGGDGATQLGNWLGATLPHLYGAQAGDHDLSFHTNAEVALFYRSLSKQGAGSPAKLDAQVFAVALAAYVTNETLAATVATSYGFLVTQYGVGTSTFNVGDGGEAFGVADNSQVAILDLLLATDDRSWNGVLYDADHDGDTDDTVGGLSESLLRALANDVYSAINEMGRR